MNTSILHEHLVRRIQQFGQDAREHRQIYRRLTKLLPDRYKEITYNMKDRSRNLSDAARAASVSVEYLNHIEEIVQFCGSSLESRIQYETHMMLIDARRALRYTRNNFRK